METTHSDESNDEPNATRPKMEMEGATSSKPKSIYPFLSLPPDVLAKIIGYTSIGGGHRTDATDRLLVMADWGRSERPEGNYKHSASGAHLRAHAVCTLYTFRVLCAARSLAPSPGHCSFCIRPEQLCVKKGIEEMNRILSGNVIIPSPDRLVLWGPISALTVCIGYRIGTAAIRSWKRRQQRKWEELQLQDIQLQLQLFLETPAATHVNSAWEKVKRGETKNGFRLWRLYENEDADEYDGRRVTSRVLVEPPWPKFDDSERIEKWSEEEPLTVLGLINRRHPQKSPDDSVLVLRRYSLLEPSIYADIVRIVYEGDDEDNHRGWSFVRQEQLNERTVAIRFVHSGDAADRIVLINTSNRSFRQFEIPPTGPPEMWPLRMFIDEDNRDHFSVLYADEKMFGSKFVKIDYEIEQSQDPTLMIARQLGMETTPFVEEAGGNGFCMLLPRMDLMQIPGVFYVWKQTPGVGFRAVGFLFDHRGHRRNFGEFPQSIRGRAFEASAKEFKKLVSSVVPTEADDHILGMHTFAEARSSNLIVYCGDLLGCINNEAIVQRRFRPPSMKRRAAEAIRRSIHKSDFSLVTKKSETGVDIFDGILEEKKMPVLMIRLEPGKVFCSTIFFSTLLFGMAFLAFIESL